MKKPINKFAVVLWVLAVVIFAVDATQIFALFSTMRNFAFPIPTHDSTLYLVFRSLGTLIVAPIQLAAVGVIIELIDQIRWNALQRTK